MPLMGDQLENGCAHEKYATYLGHWMELLMENPQMLYQVFCKARRAVACSSSHRGKTKLFE